jgi:sec-independent protein translocase protein TatC
MISQTFIEHLVELKKRVIIVLLSFGIFCAIGYIYSDKIYDFLLLPLADYFTSKGENREIIYTGLSEAFFTYIKLAIYFGIFCVFPVFMWQTYSFISPGLKLSEKKFIAPIFLISPILFYLGFIIVYYLILPAAFSFFLSFEQSNSMINLPIKLEARISEYLSLCLAIILAFGLALQLPIILVILAKLRIISSKGLKQYRRLSIVIIFIVAAIITPPDILSQIILAVIMIILYELSVFACSYIEKNRDLHARHKMD